MNLDLRHASFVVQTPLIIPSSNGYHLVNAAAHDALCCSLREDGCEEAEIEHHESLLLAVIDDEGVFIHGTRFRVG